MDDCFENCVGLVSTAKLGLAGPLEALNDKGKKETNQMSVNKPRQSLATGRYCEEGL